MVRKMVLREDTWFLACANGPVDMMYQDRSQNICGGRRGDLSPQAQCEHLLGSKEAAKALEDQVKESRGMVDDSTLPLTS